MGFCVVCINKIYLTCSRLYVIPDKIDIYDTISYYDLMPSRESSDKKMNLREATRVAHEMLRKDSSCLIIREHCRQRMLERGLNLRDVKNTLLGGNCMAVELHIQSGLHVYRFETNNYRVECNIFKYENIVAITVIKKRGRL